MTFEKLYFASTFAPEILGATLLIRACLASLPIGANLHPSTSAHPRLAPVRTLYIFLERLAPVEACSGGETCSGGGFVYIL